MTSEPVVPPLDELLAHREWVRRFARTLVRDEHAADDLVQETWLAAIEHPPRNADAPVGWLRRVLLRRAINRARGESRRGARERTAARPERVAATEDVVALAESHRCVVEEVLALDEPCRTTVLLRYFEDLAPRDVAARMGTSVDNVYARLRRAAEKLRERLDAERGSDRRRALIVLLAGPAASGESRPRPTGASAAAAAAGGTLVATKAMIGVGVVALLLLGGWAAWRALGEGSSKRDVARLDDASQRVDDGHAKRRAKEVDVLPAPEPPTVDPDAVAFTGHVVDVDGRPVAGAAVVASATRSVAELGIAARFVKALAAADGAFDLRMPKGTAMADVVASAPGFAVVAVERARPGSPVEIRLVREGVLVGRVLDPARKPIAGAAVRAFRVVGRERIDEVDVTTGADGAFRVGGWADSTGTDAPMKRPFLDVRAAGFGGTQDDGRFPNAGEELHRDVVLFPSRPMSVHVVDADSGAAVDGARVMVGLASTALQINPTREAGYVVPHPAPYLVEGTSDAKGVCVLDDTPARLPMLAQLVVRAWRRGFTAEYLPVPFRPATDDEHVEIRLWPSAIVKGRVVDASGAPVEGAGVAAGDVNAGGWFPAPFGDIPWGGWVKTDRDGHYVATCVRATAAGTGSTYVATWGVYAPTSAGIFTVDNMVRVELHPRSGEDVSAPDLVLPAPKPARAATIVVVDMNGAPVADAWIFGATARDAPTRTDESGRAVLHWPSVVGRGSPVEAEPQVSVYAPGRARTTVRCRPDASSAPEKRIVLEPGVRLAGRVLGADGRPVVGGSVNATREDSGVVLGAGAVTDVEGRFEIDDLPARAFEVFVSSAVRYDRNARTTKVSGVIPGGAPLEVTLPADRTKWGTLVATVVDEDDGPLVEAALDVKSDPEPPQSLSRFSATETPGVMTLTVPAGTWPVKATARGRISASTSATIVEGQTTQVRLVLPRGATVSVRVVPPADVAASRIDVMYAARTDAAPEAAGAGADAYSHDWTPDHQSVRFDALAVGRYRLRFETFGRRGGKSEAYVSRDAIEVGAPGRNTAQANVELVLGGFLAVTVDDAEAPAPPKSGADVAGGTVEFVAVGGERHRVVLGAPRGAMRPVGLLPGDYVVRLRLPSGRVREISATIRAGETTPVVFGQN